MSYTDLTTSWAYRGIVSWKNMDGHAKNSSEAFDELNNPYGSRHETNAGQSVSASTWTLQTSDTEDFDSSTVIDSSTYTPGHHGLHLVVGMVNFTRGASSHKENRIALYKNGSVERLGDKTYSKDSVTTYRTAPQMIALALLSDDADYLQQYCWAEEAATVTSAAGDDYGTPGFSCARVAL